MYVKSFVCHPPKAGFSILITEGGPRGDIGDFLPDVSPQRLGRELWKGKDKLREKPKYFVDRLYEV
jgi:hypothetical protein